MRLAFQRDRPGRAWRLIRGTVHRAWQGGAIAIIPLIVLGISTAIGHPESAPGWITWLWCAALCAINVIFLVGGPVLWNALITASIAIDELNMTARDAADLVAWVRGHYIGLRAQAVLAVAGAGAGIALLSFINVSSGDLFTLGAGEYAAMAMTAGLAANGLWILWWIAGLIPTLGRQESLRLDWHNPARTPAVVFLNRALWKAGGAISLGMVLLALAVQGQPSPFMSWGVAPGEWAVAIIVEYLAFMVVAIVFIRDGIWAQWQVFRLVRSQIDRSRRPVDQQLAALRALYIRPGWRERKVLYYTELDRHFDSLRTVDLNLSWALAWATSIFGAAASVLATVISTTPK